MSEPSPLIALRRIAERLRAHAKPFALIGGLAVTVRSEPRFTRDVDLCVAVRDDDEAEQLVFDLRNDGYEIAATVEHEERRRAGKLSLFVYAGSMIERKEQPCALALRDDAGTLAAVSSTTVRLTRRKAPTPAQFAAFELAAAS